MRAYLAEFLSDPRVVELPRWLWLPLLHGLVLRRRPAQSAEKYAKVWSPDGATGLGDRHVAIAVPGSRIPRGGVEAPVPAANRGDVEDD